jgi:hypothetical protein
MPVTVGRQWPGRGNLISPSHRIPSRTGCYPTQARPGYYGLTQPASEMVDGQPFRTLSGPGRPGRRLRLTGTGRRLARARRHGRQTRRQLELARASGRLPVPVSDSELSY